MNERPTSDPRHVIKLAACDAQLATVINEMITTRLSLQAESTVCLFLGGTATVNDSMEMPHARLRMTSYRLAYRVH